MVLAVIAVLVLFFFWPVILAGVIIFLVWIFWPEKKWQCLGCNKKFHRKNSCKEHTQNCEGNRLREERIGKKEKNHAQNSRKKVGKSIGTDGVKIETVHFMTIHLMMIFGRMMFMAMIRNLGKTMKSFGRI